MNTAVFRALIYADSRLLWRDRLLGWILALPIGLEHLINSVPLRDAVLAPWQWQPGWLLKSGFSTADQSGAS
jgi:hypothetical protein